MVDSKKVYSGQQTHYGNGPQIGGNLVGNIIYEISPEDRAILTKLSEDAPVIARLMETALRDGVISPEAVEALQIAVRSINLDTGEMFLRASRHMNYDTATLFLHASEVHEKAAEKFTDLNYDLTTKIRELNDAAQSLVDTAEQAGIDAVAGSLTPGIPVSPFRRGANRWSIRLVFLPFIVGAVLVTAVILKNLHLGGDTMAIGIALTVIPVFFWISKLLR